ncbi:MAG TPA: hypothetical protein PKY76_12245 [Bacteroidales bacterium]|nr:hypothetical protein [Bacteroidales bacterium]
MTATLIVLAILLAIFVAANVWARVKIKRTPLPPDHPRLTLPHFYLFFTLKYTIIEQKKY